MFGGWWEAFKSKACVDVHERWFQSTRHTMLTARSCPTQLPCTAPPNWRPAYQWGATRRGPAWAQSRLE
eukprot:279691-Alexandrium_andersonii.AAC.1